MAIALQIGLAQTPMISVEGTLRTQAWSVSGGWGMLWQDELPTESSLKVPRDLVDMTIAAGNYVQHLQVGNGPKLFGESIHVPKLDGPRWAEHLSLHAHNASDFLVDANDQPIAMNGDKLPDDISIHVKYTREADVLQAGAKFETSEVLMSRKILDNMAMYFVLPAEPIEVTVIRGDASSVHRLTLNDGETRTAKLKPSGKSPNGANRRCRLQS